MARKRTTTSRVASSRVVDDFKIIHGIGPLYEKHLRDAGNCLDLCGVCAGSVAK